MRLPVLWHPTIHFPFSQMGCYQEGIAKDSVGGKDVTAHIYEWVFRGVVHTSPSTSRHRYTTNVIVTDTGEVSKGSCPVQVLFCLKEQNKKKLNSHRWFFNAFAPLLKPNGMYWFKCFCKIFVNRPRSLCSPWCWYEANWYIYLRTLEMWGLFISINQWFTFPQGFDKHSNVGGACGE